MQDAPALVYRTAIVTVLLGVPLINTRACTAPGVTPAGITTLICHKPIYPGARPEYFTSPKRLPPSATHIEGWLLRQVDPFEVGTATVFASGDEGAAVPSGTRD